MKCPAITQVTPASYTPTGHYFTKMNEFKELFKSLFPFSLNLEYPAGVCLAGVKRRLRILDREVSRWSLHPLVVNHLQRDTSRDTEFWSSRKVLSHNVGRSVPFKGFSVPLEA